MEQLIEQMVKTNQEILAELRRGHVDGLWNLYDVAAYLRFSYDHTRTHIACKPGFPKPIKIGRERRWEPGDVRAWAARQRK